ncbi:hypothetical protein [Flagellimonas aequoris]|uniref:DUF4065 domain-containing protein n=1 Tax=Flagellimonas aequoris TaxID=2306997 RepID=A0A418N492_9FLAO|nr:hypothetical protein [Allomuricauda aequoris]RIV68684.1 hypothetical protein D2U88_15965 [Allomuricauda aequoris]TXK00383.1 hypothetical protein FQ019_15790 [Allomuricauda aequoris]
MKSTNKKKNSFTIEDFEKGLMLAGYLTPQNEQEIEEVEALKEHDKNISRQKSIVYFKRAVLAAEIVNKLKEEPTFGRVKFQKLVYLCEHACHMNLQDRYLKFTAGPFDNKFMHSINQEFKKQKWYEIEYKQSGGYVKPVYYPSDNFEKYKAYYKRYFGEMNDGIETIIELFRKMATREVELKATIYYCLLEINENNQLINNKTLIENFYKFSESKIQFSETEILNSLDWMNINGVFPSI